MVGREQLAHPQRVVGDVPGKAAEVLALRRLRGAQQLRERVDAGELVPVAVVLGPDRAHHSPGGGGGGGPAPPPGPAGPPPPPNPPPRARAPPGAPPSCPAGGPPHR